MSSLSHSESIASLAGALALAQGEVENAAKNAANPHFKSRYADLAEILNTVRPVLAKHGLAVMQVPGFSDGIVTVSTLLTHSSGEWVRGESSAPIGKADVQGVGSATTYLRRYSLAAICGIAQEDDDGNSAPPAQRQERREERPAANGNGAAASQKQTELIAKLSASHVITDTERNGIHRRVARGMTSKEASSAIEWLQAEIPARKEVEAAQATEAQTVPADEGGNNDLPF